MSARTRRLKQLQRESGVWKEGDDTIYDLRRFPRGIVSVPTVPWIYAAASKALLALSHSLPPNSALDLVVEGSSSIAVARNFIVYRFLKDPTTQWLCMIDSDMVPPPHTVLQLLAANKDIVAAKFFQRSAPYFPAVQLFEPTEEHHKCGALLEVERVGFGCVLVRRAVFEAMEPPWFRDTVPGMGEDFDWCDRARALGYKIYVDQTLDVGHLTVFPINHEFANAWIDTASGQKQIAEYAERRKQLPEWQKPKPFIP